MTGPDVTEGRGAVRAFEWADPARGLPPAEPTVDADAYLFDLLVADHEGHPIDGKRKRGALLGPTLVTAAAAVVIVGWLFGALGRASPTRLATDPASVPAVTSPTTQRQGDSADRTRVTPPYGPAVAEPTDDCSAAGSSPEAQASLETWEALTPWATGDGSRGRYRSINFHPEVSFIVPDGWARPAGSIEVRSGLAPLAREGRPGVVDGLYVAQHKDDASIAQWLIRMREHPAITVETVERKELGHVTGMEVRFEVVSPMTYVSLTEEHQQVLEGGQVGVARVAHVGGHVVSALVLAGSREELPDLEAAARPILESLHWQSLCHHP